MLPGPSPPLGCIIRGVSARHGRQPRYCLQTGQISSEAIKCSFGLWVFVKPAKLDRTHDNKASIVKDLEGEKWGISFTEKIAN